MSQLTAERYQQQVSLEALCIWRDREPERARNDWFQASAELRRETGGWVDGEQIRPRARQIYLMRKDHDAKHDWLCAERIVRDQIRSEG